MHYKSTLNTPWGWQPCTAVLTWHPWPTRTRPQQPHVETTRPETNWVLLFTAAGPLPQPSHPEGRCRASGGKWLTTQTWAGNKARQTQTGGGEKKRKRYLPFTHQAEKCNPGCKELKINFCLEPEIFAPMQSWQHTSILLFFFLWAPEYVCHTPHSKNKLH